MFTFLWLNPPRSRSDAQFFLPPSHFSLASCVRSAIILKNECTAKNMPDSHHQAVGTVDRRHFFKQVLATVIGIVLGLVPTGAGLAVWLFPLRRNALARDAMFVATLDAVPPDGVPRKFPVLPERVDAWS